MKRCTNSGKGWLVDSANIFVCIYANIIAPLVGTSVTKEHITRADTTASLSKHVVAVRLFFSATRGYTASTYMQRQYFECIMNGACECTYTGILAESPRFGLSMPRKSLFPYFAFTQQPFTTTVFSNVRYVYISSYVFNAKRQATL